MPCSVSVQSRDYVLSMGAWPFIVIVLLAPLALGGLLQVATGAVGPTLILTVLAWLGIVGAVKRIVEDRRESKGNHVGDA